MGSKYILGVYDDEITLLDSIKTIRSKGFKIDEVLTPFAVHGMEDAMGWDRSRIPIVGFIFGALGTTTALVGMGWILSSDWPQNFGGKPHFALPAFIPITFELTVLFAALSMVAAFLISCNLAPGVKKNILDKRITDDKFLISFDITQNNVDVKAIKSVLKETGATEVNEKSFEED